MRPASPVAPNLIEREFEATGPNQRCVADFTYIWTAEGWLYFAAVLDLYSRRVVGWSAANSMTAELVTDALLMALWRRGRPQALLHHSGQGSQYASAALPRLLAAHGVTCSMNRQGNVWDNSAMESFFSSLKTERVNRRMYATGDQARADVFDYVERFYNQRRRHSTIGYVSPAEYEKRGDLNLGRCHPRRYKAGLGTRPVGDELIHLEGTLVPLTAGSYRIGRYNYQLGWNSEFA